MNIFLKQLLMTLPIDLKTQDETLAMAAIRAVGGLYAIHYESYVA